MTYAATSHSGVVNHICTVFEKHKIMMGQK